ncbi:MAG: hypothetical protein JXK95_07695 [Bacteroidales bacterium]|nr:hypothetical protein [Bacteroidales bacterium]
MKKFFLFAACLFTLTMAPGQDYASEKTGNNEFGFHAGATTGLGLSYRHWFNRAGFQLTALPIRTDDITFISAGVTALYSFYDSKYVTVFGYFGNHFFIHEEDGEEYNWNTGTYEPDHYDDTAYSFGIGPGFAFGKTVRFNLMVGYGFYDVFEKLNMYPTGEIGLYYRF